jgi:hypothetical protein
MTLIRLIQRASILAGMTFAILPIHNNPAQADTPQICVVASNGKTACGTLKAVERACVTTDAGGTVCGKFKSAKEGQEQGQESRQPVQGNAPRTVVGNIAFSLKGCGRSETTVKCSFSVVNKGAEKDIVVIGHMAKFTDFSGKTYKGSNAEIGGKSEGAPSMKLATDINYEAAITFENIPVGVQKAQVLSFPFEGKTVNLRNISISN